MDKKSHTHKKEADFTLFATSPRKIIAWVERLNLYEKIQYREFWVFTYTFI